jgi:hypothetical protein
MRRIWGCEVKRLVQWLVIGVALSGTAWAQSMSPIADPCWMRPVSVSEAVWNAMTAAERVEACEIATFGPKPTTRDNSPALKHAGWAMVLIGAFQMIPNGTSYTIFGEGVCVTDYEVSGGHCSTSNTKLLVAVVTIGTGLVFAKIGGRQVAIAPSVTQQKASVTAKVIW